MDTHAFASLAHLRLLLIPVGDIAPSSFESYANEIRSFESLRLSDIPNGHKDERARFMPNPMSTGSLLLTFPTHPPPRSHLPLSLIRPSHFPLAVIGIASCSKKEDSLSSIFAQFKSSLLDIFPTEGMFPLAKNCFVFEETDETQSPNGDKLPGLVTIPHVMGNKKLYIGTLLADLCSQVLGEFGVLVQALESPLGNEYLNSSTLPLVPPLDEIPSPLNGLQRDVPPAISSHSSQPDVGRQSFSLSAPPAVKRTSSAGAALPQPRNSDKPRKRLSTIGAASSHARLFKILGDLFLLAGRLEDANVWYSEALLLLKSSQDFPWHAAVLEGMATVQIVEAWTTGISGDTNPNATKEPWADIAEKISQAAALHQKSPTSDSEPNYSLLSYLYCCCVLRHTSLLFAVWSAKGWGALAFSTMLQSSIIPQLPPTLAQGDEVTWGQLERLSSFSGIQKSAIVNVLTHVHGPWLLHLGARERIAILEITSSIYSCLGYKRKEAYILREVLGCILDLMVCGREEDGLSRVSHAPGTAGLGISGLNNQSWNGVGIRMTESTEGNESILRLLKYVCKVLAIDLEAVKLVEVADPNETTPTSTESYDEEILAQRHQLFGWPELQIGVVREAVAVAEALPDFPAVAQFALSALKTLQDIFPPGDQYHLYSTSARALATAKRRGDGSHVEYWSGRPIVSITMALAPSTRLTVEKTAADLRQQTNILTGGTDPFLYNPRKATAQGKSLIVQNEVLEFVVVLQNPYIFDLELQSLKLSTSGVQFDTAPIRVLIPAGTLHEVVLSGKAVETGTLTIRGCHVQAVNGAPREFLLPLFTDDEEERLSSRKGAIACEIDRFKYSGVDAFLSGKYKQQTASKRGSNQAIRFLECKVIPEQPLLRVRRTSVSHGALMLYNGEETKLWVTLENVSPLAINFLRLAFDDNTIAPAQQALAEGELSVFETYETEYSLTQRPVFSWNEESTPIDPGQKLTVNVTCKGKVSCQNGTIHFLYSLADPTDPGSASVFHTRQLSYQIMITVYHMLECHAMDIMPFPRYSADTYMQSDLSATHTGPWFGEEEGAWCLFSVEVRNTYGLPFDVTFERVQDGVPPAEVTTLVPPGSMTRLVIPLKKVTLTEEELSKEIPTLSDRQFVVQKVKLSKEEEKIQRELFWYREHLLKSVRGRWRESGGIRSGELSLRQQRMSLSMLEAFKQEDLRVEMALVKYEGSHTEDSLIHQDDGKYYPQVDEFIFLRIKLSNLSPVSRVFLMNVRMSPAEHVLYEGSLNDLPVGRLSSGESKEMDIGLCFLGFGRFDIITDVKPLGSASKTGDGHLSAVVREKVA